MHARFRTYNADRDFLRIRDFLAETFSLTDQPLNSRLERWNYAHYFITPLPATDGVGEPDRSAYQVAIVPDGEFASFCIAWWDERNCIVMLEPVGTVPEHRRKGLARAVVLEAIRRVAALGAKRVFVGSDQAFYLSLGFELKYAGHHWEKEF